MKRDQLDQHHQYYQHHQHHRRHQRHQRGFEATFSTLRVREHIMQRYMSRKARARPAAFPALLTILTIIILSFWTVVVSKGHPTSTPGTYHYLTINMNATCLSTFQQVRVSALANPRQPLSAFCKLTLSRFLAVLQYNYSITYNPKKRRWRESNPSFDVCIIVYYRALSSILVYYHVLSCKSVRNLPTGPRRRPLCSVRDNVLCD